MHASYTQNSDTRINAGWWLQSACMVKKGGISDGAQGLLLRHKVCRHHVNLDVAPSILSLSRGRINKNWKHLCVCVCVCEGPLKNHL